ncbi:hypothetical protein ILYODFUR_014003 [Ilyodon furcidens]|uniref:Uncharacterized protein n=1 Tax=Ilyodon furcidens TaxID=33524 RepID=A0ABV0SL17_9TELE
MPGSHGTIFKLSADFQNLRDPTCNDKKIVGIMGLVLQCVEFSHRVSTTHHTRTDFTQKHSDFRHLANPLEIKREFRVIPFRVSVTSLYDLLHVTFNRLRARLSSGNTPHPRKLAQDDPKC